MSSNPVIAAVETELRLYPGVKMERHTGGKHLRLVFHRNGNSRFLTVPRAPGDWRASKNAVRDFRTTMRELGAPRLEQTPVRKKQRRNKRGSIATFGMNEKLIVLHIPATSKLLNRFRTRDGKAAAHWEFELRPSVDLTAPPLLVVRQAEVPAGQKIKKGLVSGFNINGAWRVTMARVMMPSLSNRIDHIEMTPVSLYEDNERELVFKLPPGTIPTSFKPHPPANGTEVQEAAPLPSQAWPEGMDAREKEALDTLLLEQDADLARAPTAAEMARARAQQAIGQEQPPIVLQFPKQTVSVEQAVNILNKAKRRLGNNLRFTVGPEGFLTAAHRIGH